MNVLVQIFLRSPRMSSKKSGGKFRHIRLPIPDPDRLVVRGTQNPRVLMVELHCTNVVQMPKQCEQAPPQLIVPDLDLVVIATRDKKWLRSVETDAAYGTC